MTKRSRIALLACALAAPAAAEEMDQALVREALSPGAEIWSFQLANQTDFGIWNGGGVHRTGNTTLPEVFFPTAISEGWNLTHRIRLPLVWSPELNASYGGAYGIGDIRYELHLAPAGSSPTLWAIGVANLLPTASDDRTGEHKWASGPSIAATTSLGPVVLGFTARQLWTWASTGSFPDVDRFSLEPHLAWALGSSWFVLSTPVITANWKKPKGDVWTVPLGGGFAKMLAPGGQKLFLTLQAFGYLLRPEVGSPAWSLRVGLGLLFPPH